MPPITFIAAEAFTTAMVAPVPRRARSGDLLLAVVMTTHTAVLDLPDGWVELAHLTAPTTAHAAIWLVRHRVDDLEPASHRFGVDAGAVWGCVLLYRGLAESLPVAVAAADQAVSTGHKTPQVSTTTYSDLLLAVWATFATPAWTSPSVLDGVTERFNAESPDGAVSATLVVADILPSTVGPIGGVTATVASGTTAIACTIALAATPPPAAVAITRPTPGAIGIMEV